MKICTKCKEEKNLDQFYKMKASKDGHAHACKTCRDAMVKLYHQKHKDEISAKKKDYYLKNKEKYKARSGKQKPQCKEYVKRYQKENAERIQEVRRKHKAEHPEKYSAFGRARRARERGAEGFHSAYDVLAILEKQKYLCANCSVKLVKSGKKRYHVDHIIPLSKGGSDWPQNLQMLCPTCNHRKHAKDPLEWAKENGKLL